MNRTTQSKILKLLAMRGFRGMLMIREDAPEKIERLLELQSLQISKHRPSIRPFLATEPHHDRFRYHT